MCEVSIVDVSYGRIAVFEGAAAAIRNKVLSWAIFYNLTLFLEYSLDRIWIRFRFLHYFQRLLPLYLMPYVVVVEYFLIFFVISNSFSPHSTFWFQLIKRLFSPVVIVQVYLINLFSDIFHAISHGLVIGCFSSRLSCKANLSLAFYHIVP